MCRESDPLLLTEQVDDDALRLYYGGTPPQAESGPQQTATPQNEHDAESAELVA
jgi:hypothetical protein